jgi:hypothetical protein
MVNPFLYEVEEIDTAYLVADESQQVSPSTAEEDRDKLQAPPTNESQNEDTSAVNLVQDGQNMSVPAPDNETITPRTFKRKLDGARLPPTKRVGRPRKAKAFDHYKYTGKPFQSEVNI